MKLPPLAHVAPRRLPEAVARLAEAPPGQALPLAGGQSLIPQLAARSRTARLLVDLRDIGELTGVSERAGLLRIGAMTRQHTLATDPLVRAASPLLAEAAATTGHASVRHRGTLGGTLAHAAGQAQLVVAAYALHAQLLVTGPDGTRTGDLRSWFGGPHAPGVAPDEILTAVHVPPHRSGRGCALAQYAHPVGGRPAATVAAIVDTAPDGTLLRAELTVGTRVSPPAALDVTHRWAEAGEAAAWTVRAAPTEPLDRQEPPATHIRHVVRVLADRALTEALTRARHRAPGTPPPPPEETP
ncbi:MULTISPECIES: FAD binding domain-containing protein [unclassified Streptomyces]|uniref:FAD binding domain-containing protein n=1 Tax=unclassified Streptomyces TaxID=2593676 RepID=UPI000DBA6A1C|nr:FAD binding domain-containing protein [Streptomyces sp. PsTaAH-137]MYT68247.1 hypothetical protein [Streptomyces sp. SID8367]RAJ76879.1 carbon-monoxide dehydrogenase medium subunit [Streptomyces sp. PsTaAH-137]